MTTEAHEKEEAILAAVKKALTLVIKDTATPPELKHPLSKTTILNLRQCLSLISAREQELAKLLGKEMNERPYYIDDPRHSSNGPLEKQDGVIVDFPKTDD